MHHAAYRILRFGALMALGAALAAGGIAAWAVFG